MARKSIFEELNNLAPVRDKNLIVENRADHIIASAINLFEYINKTYSDEEADQLLKRFISSIKGKDPKRFQRAVSRINESKGSE